MSRSVALTLLVAVLASADTALAQRPLPPVPLDSGRLVRLRLEDQTVVRGRLLRPFAAGDLEVTFCRYPVPSCRSPGARGVMTLATERIAMLEVQRGTRLWRGVAIGAGIGSVLGGMAGVFHNGLCDAAGCRTPIPYYVMSAAVVGGLWGALFGSQSVVWGSP
jgi:hypothetical protein